MFQLSVVIVGVPRSSELLIDIITIIHFIHMIHSNQIQEKTLITRIDIKGMQSNRHLACIYDMKNSLCTVIHWQAIGHEVFTTVIHLQVIGPGNKAR